MELVDEKNRQGLKSCAKDKVGQEPHEKKWPCSATLVNFTLAVIN
jgi:hypothetical protein